MDEHLGDRQADAYLSELLSYSLERLRKEPEVLAEERARVARGLTAAAVSHHRAFLDAAACLETVRADLDAIAGSLGRLVGEVPALAAACDGFSRGAGAALAQHASNRALLAQAPALAELLEAPALMDTCARNGAYDEALDLHALVHRLGVLHGGLPAVRLLVGQADGVLASMRAALLGRLRGPLQLPECLRVVGYLRRVCAGLPEHALRARFLACRDEWLADALAELDEGEPYEYVKALTELHRLHLSDIVMQYRAVFFDDASGGGGGGGAGASGGDPAAAAAAARDSAALHAWAQHRLEGYAAALGERLPAVRDGANLASALEAVSYCGASLGRVGLDLQGLLAPLFEACALQLFGGHLAAAADAFALRLQGHRWLALGAAAAAPPPAKRAADAAAAAAAAGDDAGAGADAALAPPPALMDHGPVAVFANGALAALNELRHCALPALARPAGQLLLAALEQAGGAMAHSGAARSLSGPEAALFAAAAAALADVAAPHLAACFARIYPGGGPLKLDGAMASALVRDALADSAPPRA